MAHMDTPETQRANRRYMKQAMTVPLLDEQHEFDLARRWKDHGDEQALHELTCAYMRLVISLATRFRNYGLPYGDLIQEGNVGLMQAAARFEPERGVRFSTYASWWIRAAIQDYILRNWSIVRTGTTAAHKSLFFNLRRLRALIANGTRQNLTEDDRIFIAKRLGVGASDVATIDARLMTGDRSLNATVSDSTSSENLTEWQDLLPCERPLPEEEVMENHDSKQRSRWIEGALESLNERELTIIRERRLRDDVATLETLGVRLGISKERVRQIEHMALKKLRTALLDKVPDPEAAGLLA
ncbi:RNA polymerase, sigma 32 subunit, RpoH [Parvibaculum lavamentivorans DS-1]|uniref:RNA polymerase, sigma 32 subunit, RpoH n=1 Tax=Parvibaculum lavamentivorans (strain DS-1 / DSM 13023 / NCIMB 13966) TaxID=402881 RepID=A7HTS9_PARL1|nr:RNA polymerase, sigma 32 subunit, RpoH [Parvibaculum lavamentivorans DS-1]